MAKGDEIFCELDHDRLVQRLARVTAGDLELPDGAWR
jgi:hypothetical protein